VRKSYLREPVLAGVKFHDHPGAGQDHNGGVDDLQSSYDNKWVGRDRRVLVESRPGAEVLEEIGGIEVVPALVVIDDSG
jgi:hypothetical protein